MLCRPEQRLFSCFAASKIFLAVLQLEKKTRFFRTTAQKKNSETALYILGIVTILLASKRKTLKCYRFESVQVSFLLHNFFFRLLVVYFAAEASIVFNFF